MSRAGLFVVFVLGCDGAPEAPKAPEQTEPHPAAASASALPEPEGPKQALTTPYPAPAGPDVEKALEVLGAVVDQHAADPEDPWAITHALLARGERLVLTNGRPAIEHLFERFAQVEVVNGERLPHFPRTLGEVNVEPHTDLTLKNLTEIGLTPTRVVKVGDEELTLADAWQHSLMTTYLTADGSKTSFDSPNDMPWAVQGLAAWAPKGLRWTSTNGTAMSLDKLVELQVHVLASESQDLFAAMASGGPFVKRGQGIFKYTCGGAHLLQGSAYAVARGFGGEAERQKLQAQGKLLFWRLTEETNLYAQAITQQPSMRLILMAQQLKFLGHWLESAHKLMALGLYTPDAAEQQKLNDAVNLTIETTRTLKALGAFDNLPEIKTKNPQLYKDIVGDSSHAVRGLNLALGRGAVVL
ncbi:hypothetical protein L6R49_06995 [Myxococcota bacterium]|nr:hypothetical protein [Myxococcota bacterium]